MARLRVREVAEAHGITNAAQLSRKADIGYTTAYNIWTNPSHPANLDTLNAIAAALKVTVKDLIVDDEPQQRNG